MEKETTATFKDLRVWRTAYKLCLLIYTSTDSYPKNEQFGLTSQIRRAVVSVSSNIAEGYSRKSSKDKEHFYIMSYGSLTEVESQLEISRGLKFIDEKSYTEIYSGITICKKQLNALLKSHRS